MSESGFNFDFGGGGWDAPAYTPPAPAYTPTTPAYSTPDVWGGGSTGSSTGTGGMESWKFDPNQSLSPFSRVTGGSQTPSPITIEQIAASPNGGLLTHIDNLMAAPGSLWDKLKGLGTYLTDADGKPKSTKDVVAALASAAKSMDDKQKQQTAALSAASRQGGAPQIARGSTANFMPQQPVGASYSHVPGQSLGGGALQTLFSPDAPRGFSQGILND